VEVFERWCCWKKKNGGRIFKVKVESRREVVFTSGSPSHDIRVRSSKIFLNLIRAATISLDNFISKGWRGMIES